ncbi:7762_t:CDS:2 [Paraglomus occultum]|uniref:DNA-binding protein RAP1 n=1 Tax=Paraglomus occultum TaxID=144539 RepID=A0A9N8Z6L0_9GLOM|nr:7762_t:CDS:2 [Paraglomus occultum]
MNARTKKVGRAHYTKEEDDKLVQFILEQQKLNSYLKGNGIYKKIEPEFPRHTWHSLRDHALKKIIPNLQNYQQAAPVIKEKSTSQSSPTTQSVNPSSDLTSTALPSSATPDTKSTTQHRGVCTEHNYCENDADDIVDSVKELGEDLKTKRESKEFSKLEWDDRSMLEVVEEHIKKRKQAMKKKGFLRLVGE